MRLESRKAPGILKATIREKHQLILDLFNTCLERGRFPKQWNRQKLVLIPKDKSKDPQARCMLDSAGKLQNTFNTANWEHICQALHRRLPEYLMRIASSYLEDRTLIVEAEGGSIEVEITAGLAKGSVGGPTIWNIHYDGLLRLELPKDVTLVGYADDVAMVAVAATIEELEWKYNETLEMVSCWMKAHGLQLAQEKSEAVLVTKRRKFEHPKLELDGYTIQFQDSIWYLGIWIDKHWNFKDHIRRTLAKAGNVGTALQQLMPNVGGPKQGSRALLATVVRKMAPVQRRISL